MADNGKSSKGGPRKADQFAGANSIAEALKKARKAKEQGNLRKARRIMQEFQRGNS